MTKHLIPAHLYDSVRSLAESLGGVGSGSLTTDDDKDHIPNCGAALVAVCSGLKLHINILFPLKHRLADLGYTATDAGYDDAYHHFWTENDEVVHRWRQTLDDTQPLNKRMPFDLWATAMGWERTDV